MAAGAAFQVRIGADISDLKANLDKAKVLAETSSAAFQKALTAAKSTADGQKQLNDEINNSTKLVRALAQQVDKKDKDAVRTLRDLIGTQKIYNNAVGATAVQVITLQGAELQLEAAVERANKAQVKHNTIINEATGHVTTFGHKGVSAFEAVTTAAANFANGSESGLKTAATALSSFALSFGAGGIVGAALISGGEAMYNYFNRAREEATKTREKFVEEMRNLVRAGDTLGLTKKARDVFTGDPAAGASNVRPGVFKGGLGDLQAARQGVSYQLENAAALGKTVPQILALRSRLAELDKAIAPLAKEFADISNAIRNPVRLPNDIVGLRPFEIHDKDPFSTKTERARKAKGLPTFEPSPNLGDQVLRNAKLPESVTDINKYINDKLKAAEDVNTKGAKSPEALLQEIVKGMENKLARPMTALDRTLARQQAASENLRNTMANVGQQFLYAAQSFIASKVGGGAAGAFGAGVGGALGNAAGGVIGAQIGGIAGSAVPVIGTIVGSIAGGLIGKGLGSLFGGNEKSVNRASAAVDRMANAAQKATEALTNMPAGFRVESYRYKFGGATTTRPPTPPYDGPEGGGNPGGKFGRPPGSGPGNDSPKTGNTIVFTGPVSIQANDPVELVNQIGVQAQRAGLRGGSTRFSLAVAGI